MPTDPRAQERLASQSLAMMLHALTSDCPCLPCKTLRTQARQLALSLEASGDLSHEIPSKSSRDGPSEASPDPQLTQAPREAAFDGVTEDL